MSDTSPRTLADLAEGIAGDGRKAAPGGPAGLVGSSETKCTGTRVYRGERRIARLRKAVPVAAEYMQADAVRGGFRASVAMVTLTYRPDAEWAANHVRDFQRCVEAYLARRGLRYRGIWVLEQTKRGVPHYHVLVWLNRAHLEGRRLPKPDERGWWPHGLTRIEWARNAVGYMVKYTSKAQHASSFPAGARLFGVKGLRGPMRRAYRLRMLPFWLKAQSEADTLWRRSTGGWWVSEAGEMVQSPWTIVRRAADWAWVEFGLRSEAAGVEVIHTGRPRGAAKSPGGLPGAPAFSRGRGSEAEGRRPESEPPAPRGGLRRCFARAASQQPTGWDRYEVERAER